MQLTARVPVEKTHLFNQIPDHITHIICTPRLASVLEREHEQREKQEKEINQRLAQKHRQANNPLAPLKGVSNG